MSDLWWMIPFGLLLVWLLVKAFGGGGPPTDGGSDRDIGNARDLSSL